MFIDMKLIDIFNITQSIFSRVQSLRRIKTSNKYFIVSKKYNFIEISLDSLENLASRII